MRSARLLWVWASATWVALTIVRRMFRGEVVVLSAHGAPVVRVAAILLVFLASCAEKLRPTPAEPGAEDMSQKPGDPAAVVTPAPVPEQPGVAYEFPAGLDDAALARAYRWSGKRNLWAWFAGESTPDAAIPSAGRVDPVITEVVDDFVAKAAQHVARTRAGEAETAASLTALLDALEAFHLYDAWMVAHLWQHARALRPAPVVLFSRLERHVQVGNALALAEASTGPVEFSAWRSKAGPPRGWTGVEVPAGLAAAARAAFPNAHAGTWESQAVLPLTVARGELVLVRRGGERRLTAGMQLELRRLDVLRAASATTLQHPKLGAVVVPAGSELTAWNVGEFLSSSARDELRADIRRAQSGETDALAVLEAIIVAAHAELRLALSQRPDARGAAGLRLVLANYDE